MRATSIKLNEFIQSPEWSAELKEEFFKKLKRSPSNYHRVQNCIIKAIKIAESNNITKVDDALFLIDYALKNYCSDNFSKARAFASKGIILEKYKEDFSKAREYYDKWAGLKTNLAGHEMDRLRILLRLNNLIPTQEFIEYFRATLKEIYNLPTRNFRFWMSVCCAVAYLYENYLEDAKRMAAEALLIYNEKAPTLLQRKFKSFVRAEDSIMVTDKEIKILKKLSKRTIF